MLCVEYEDRLVEISKWLCIDGLPKSDSGVASY